MCRSLELIQQVPGHPSTPLVHYEPISWGVNITPLCQCRGGGEVPDNLHRIVFNGVWSILTTSEIYWGTGIKDMTT